MAQKLIRDIPDHVMAAIEQKAAASPHKNSEAYIRDLIIRDASGPIVREEYTIRAYNDEDGDRAFIRRAKNLPGLVQMTHSMLPEDVAKDIQKARDYVYRNQPGDREKAMRLLMAHFENVFEAGI
jgi:hypothetical protein